jgi:hypothetical protein
MNSEVVDKPDTSHLAKATVGAVSELIAAADLLRRGFTTARSLSASAPFDLTAVVGDRVLRFEVRTGYRTASKRDPKRRRLQYNKEARGCIDHFIVVVWKDGGYDVVYVPPLGTTAEDFLPNEGVEDPTLVEVIDDIN